VSSDIGQLETAALVVNDDTPPEVCADLLTKLDFMKQRIREVERDLKERLVEWCHVGNRSIVVGGGVRYYAGDEKETKCNDARKVLEALFEQCGGDFDAVAECLASGAWKPGACREVLPPARFAELFRVEVKVALKEGKAVKKLIKVDERFTK
jgi:hypothetical protein